MRKYLADVTRPHANAFADRRLHERALQDYAAQLAVQARAAPYNWFNFYDFWADGR